MKGKRLIISGGGTAGHLYPALVIAQKLKEKAPEIQITFVGSSRKLEKTIMEHYKADFISLKIEGIKGKGLKIVKSLLVLPYSFIKSLAILIRIKPALVIGVGGYSSGPIVILSSWIKIPTLIMEQNVYPGFTNRMLVPWVKKAVVAFENSLPHFKGKGVFIGNPVREEFYNLPPKMTNHKLSILIFGGSQGSHFLNKGVVDSLQFLKKDKDNLRIFHQTGKEDYEWVKNCYTQNEFRDVVVSSYFYNIADYFQKSDIIISRAGATTIAELTAAQKASMLIPFSKATDNHQVLNARELEKINSAEVILEKEFTPKYFANKILNFVNNKEKIIRMAKNLECLKTENVPERILQLCLELLETKDREEMT